MQGLGRTVYALDLSQDGKLLAAGEYKKDAELRLWDIDKGKEVRRLPGKSAFHSADFSPDGRTLVTTDYGIGRLWEVATGKEIRRFEGGATGVDKAIFSPDGRHIALAGERRIAIVDAATGQEIIKEAGHPGMIWSIALSPNGKALATAGGGT